MRLSRSCRELFTSNPFNFISAQVPQFKRTENAPAFRSLLPLVLLAAFALVLFPALGFAAEAEADPAYRRFSTNISSRVAIWIVAQIHLYFAAFVLAVPMFALIIEFVGYKTKDKKYDKLAHEFTKLLSVSFSLTATTGAILTFMLIVLYPKFTSYLAGIFGPTFFWYACLFFAEAFFLYTYYYGWGKFSPRVHLLLGLGLNIVGTAIMFIANSWVTFMTSPGGIDDQGRLLDLSQAMMNYTWMPINIHRVIANVAFGGSIAAAYGAYKFLGAKTDEQRAYYDWMGYMGNFIAVCAFLPLPFAGYWLGKEIYGYSQNLGMTLMGGAFSWLFIIQAILIGALFLSANFYLWLGMGRIPGSERYKGYIKYILIVIVVCFAIWATPSSIIATPDETSRMGGSQHPMLKFFGVMSAKNTAVNILILSTYISFFLYRRGNKTPSLEGAKTSSFTQLLLVGLSVAFLGWMTKFAFFAPYFGHADPSIIDPTTAQTTLAWIGTVLLAGFVVVLVGAYFKYRANNPEPFLSWAPIGSTVQFCIVTSTIVYVIFIGIYGYFVPTAVRIKMSVPQVLAVIIAMVLISVIDVLILKNARSSGGIRWGKMRNASQYALFLTAITFTWLMGLMGYVRSGLRQHWHVYGVIRDTSPDAYTPTLGYAAGIVSITVILFFLLVAFVFWLAGLGHMPDYDGGEPASEDDFDLTQPDKLSAAGY